MKWAMSVAADVKPDEQNPPCIDVAGDPRRQALLNAVVAMLDVNVPSLARYVNESAPLKLAAGV